MKSSIWLCHAGCGKTTAAKERSDALDMTIGEYKYLHPIRTSDERAGEQIKGTLSEQNPDWPMNYFEALIAEREKGEYRHIFAPAIVRLAYSLQCGLIGAEPIPYTLVYPDVSLKNEFRERYIARGNTEKFLDIFINNGQWEGWLSDFEILEPTRRIVLQSGEYLVDYLDC